MTSSIKHQLSPPHDKAPPHFRFSGHETFPCRYTWLPKTVRCLSEENKDAPFLFCDEDGAMVRLGVGKNMVRAIRFWADVGGVIESVDGGEGLAVTKFGKLIFGSSGYDEFLEDIKTLWLIHWRFATNFQEPLFAWHFMLNCWHQPDFTRTETLQVFQKETSRLERKLSAVTLEHHFTTFLHTYVPTRNRKGELLEDNLDCPLVELELIRKVGERFNDGAGRRESIYGFRFEDKPEITPELFTFCLDEYWRNRHPSEKTLSLRHVAIDEGSPGQVFKLPEQAIRERLELIEKESRGVFVYQESAALQQLVRSRDIGGEKLLNRIYRANN